tara:strand:- start:985 stop:2253 length:1269 start_codon:yes stop_codon:yes gene_type:complete
MDKIQSIKGTHDILPNESEKWKDLEDIIYKTCDLFGFKEIRTPIFEKTNLFLRGIGEVTDIVSKEMYSWQDRDGSNLTLRPELTASVVRSYIQHNLQNQSSSQRLFYMGPLFRRERPQKGRQRQFHQFGVEAFGSENPEQDVEIISIAWHLLSLLGISNKVQLKINSIGSNQCRKNYRKALLDFIKPHFNILSEVSKVRFKKNPLRILDTKNPEERKILSNAPKISDYYTNEDKTHFQTILKFLDCLNIPYNIDLGLVRGLDYYTRTVFEFTSNSLGAQDALLGGGRYDNLVQDLGGKVVPGIGFAAGIERLLLILEAEKYNFKKHTPDIYFICIEQNAIQVMLSLSKKLREKNYIVVFDLLRRSLKAQMREANKFKVRYVIIIGEEELAHKKVTIKDLQKKAQYSYNQSDLFDFFNFKINS